ncbi:sulfite exporter TauE/SafE family protein [Chamaesiphon polymorphus]|uniref:Probable membrane transporter protein n=1 Tax=Chamaesiphon polymorphus CCALA 037 TaxID=2107692 RepID=A0A2T1GK11_9CYAN|nr:sulfite exporter TauE/SafE family protein [Chamaesiphon polymorphus]PSB58124.1 sulfite exporter TauE/SafE family protein [Chamaesiphon polymorphus CCALA 037]
MTSLPWSIEVVVGSGMGFCSGLFGLGGSSIGTPILRLLGLPALIALASPLPLTLPSAVGGAIAYRNTPLIHWRIAVLTSLWGSPGVIAGSLLTKFLHGTVLMLFTALFILGVGVYGLSGLRNRATPEPRAQLNERIVPYWSPLVGLINGLLANGGGLLLVPFYQLGIGLELRAALATSLATVALMALPSTIVHTALGHIDWVLTGWLAIGVFPFTYLGGQLALHLPTPILTRLYSLFLIALALYFGYIEIASLLPK